MRIMGAFRTLALQQPHEDALRWRGQLAPDRVQDPRLLRGQRRAQGAWKRPYDVFDQVQAVGGLCAPASRRLDAVSVAILAAAPTPAPLAIGGIQSGFARGTVAFGCNTVPFGGRALLLWPTERWGSVCMLGDLALLARARLSGPRVPQRQPGHRPAVLRARSHRRSTYPSSAGCRSFPDFLPLGVDGWGRRWGGGDVRVDAVLCAGRASARARAGARSGAGRRIRPDNATTADREGWPRLGGRLDLGTYRCPRISLLPCAPRALNVTHAAPRPARNGSTPGALHRQYPRI